MVQNDQRGFFGIIISKEILEDKDLSITEKFIYGYIASFRKCCFESNEAIAEKIGVSESTIKHAIPVLAAKGYLFVEKINGNNNARRIYSVLDNPKKIAYLAKKGMFGDCGKTCGKQEGVVQKMHDVVQNLHNTKTGVRSAKFAHIEKEYNKNKVKYEQKPNAGSANTTGGFAGKEPAAGLPKRDNFETEEQYEKALYAARTVVLSN